MRLGTLLAAAALALFGFTAPALALSPAEKLADPVLEERARDLSKGLRCVVCQNQSIDDSDAELARDLRILVRQRLEAGDSDREVLQFVVDRYGEYVLLKPPFKSSTYVLWLGPFALLLGSLFAVFMFFRRRPAQAEPGPVRLSAEEERKLKKLLGDAP